MKRAGIAIGVPFEAYAVLQYRKKKTGCSISQQLRDLILGSAKPGEQEAAKGEPHEN